MELLGIVPAAYVSWETDKAAGRVIRAAWPGAYTFADIRTASKEQFWEIRNAHPRLRYGLRGCAFLNCFSCRRSNLSSSKSITRYRKLCSGAVSPPVIVCENDRPGICNVSAYASDCGRLLISSFTVVKHVLLLVEPFLA